MKKTKAYSFLIPFLVWAVFAWLFIGTILLVFETGCNFWDSQLFIYAFWLSIAIRYFPLRSWFRRASKKRVIEETFTQFK